VAILQVLEIFQSDSLELLYICSVLVCPWFCHWSCYQRLGKMPPITSTD